MSNASRAEPVTVADERTSRALPTDPPGPTRDEHPMRNDSSARARSSLAPIVVVSVVDGRYAVKPASRPASPQER
jgi:hypothetical protein